MTPRFVSLIAGLLLSVPTSLLADDEPIRIGAKSFTENIILAHIAGQLAEQTGHTADVQVMSGSTFVFDSLRNGEIDVYPEYSGTLIKELLVEQGAQTIGQAEAALHELGLRITLPIGFENNYVIGVRRAVAEERGLRSISDLANHPDLRLGFSDEFFERQDGWPRVKSAYGLQPQNATRLDHDLAYRQLSGAQLDVIDLYSTDAEILIYDLVPLEDNRGVFPAYRAYYLYRAELEERAPTFVTALRAMAGSINEEQMRALNARVRDPDQTPSVSERQAAEEFLNGDEATSERSESAWRERLRRITSYTGQHLFLVGMSMVLGIMVAVPLGLLAAKLPRAKSGIFLTVSIIQTIPSLALLALMIPLLRPSLAPLFGSAYPPAIAALFLYSLLPIVRNTYTGLAGIPHPLRESAEALGLGWWDRLWKIELPLAAPAILSGIKISTVLIIGFATLGALIGAGGYGQPILSGIRLNRSDLIFEGAIPAAAMALIAELLFDRAEPWLVPKGLRLKR
jgi:osmoprotectant transport system permease protein